MSTGPSIARTDETALSSAWRTTAISAVREIAETLRGARATVATAESCTGGLLSAILTDIPGSSTYFLGGVISYANEVKEQLLGVKTTTLIAHGAVSAACVIEMACGVRERLGTTFGVAVSGIAGPAGGTVEKPVGTVHFAVASRAGCLTEKHIFPGDREQIRNASVLAALRLLRRSIAGQQAEQPAEQPGKPPESR